MTWSGPALAEFVNQFVAHNRMLEGGFVIEDRLLSLADIAVRVLSVVGTVDDIAPAGGVRAIRQAAPRADVYELAIQAGHFGLVVGSLSSTVTWSALAAVAAINRIGAVAVLMRPDGDPRREAALGQIERVIADPERAGLPPRWSLSYPQTFVLGGGGRATGPRHRARDRHGADRPVPAVTPPRSGTGRRGPCLHRVQRRGRVHAREPDDRRGRSRRSGRPRRPLWSLRHRLQHHARVPPRPV